MQVDLASPEVTATSAEIVYPGPIGELRRGWRVILAALVGLTCGVTGLFFYSAGIFLKPLASEFGWSRTALSTVNLIAALTLAGTGPFAGWVVDRLGARTVAASANIGLATGFILLSHAPASFPLYLVLVALTVLLAAGSSPVGFTRLINMIFDRARGTALGLAQMASGVAGAVLPPLLIPYVAGHGWRAGYVALAVTTLVSMPVVFFLIGDPARISNGPRRDIEGRSLSQHPPGASFEEAVRTPTFYILSAIFAAAAIGVGGMIVHLVPMLTDAGMSVTRAGAIAGSLGLAIIFGRASTGVLADRIFAPRIAFVAFGAAACGCGLLAWGGTSWAPVGAVLVGLAMGAEVDLIGYCVARYFGLAAYGRIYGWLYAVFMVGTALGPLVAGAAYDHFGNYRIGVAVLGLALGTAAVMTFRLPPFRAPAGASRPA